jgi:hypothetical protein
MVDQMNRDDNIKKLIVLLNDVFDFLGLGPQLETITRLMDKTESVSTGRFDTQIRVLVLLLQQATECTHFICAYAMDTNYCMLFVCLTIADSQHGNSRETDHQALHLGGRPENNRVSGCFQQAKI